MELNQFSASLVTSPEEAKNLLTLLIGFNFSGQKEKVTDSIIAVYESFHDDYKKQDKIFALAFNKLFHKYPIQSQHLPYFIKYSPLWPIADTETIRKKNELVLKGVDKKVYKNSLEFSKALSVYTGRGSYQDIVKFLNESTDCIIELIEKNKSKFIENLNKQRCWPALIKGNYDEFSKFCDKFNLNRFDIIKSEYFSSFYGLKHQIEYFDDDKFHKMLNDLDSQPDFYNGTQFFTCTSKRENKYDLNVLHVAIFCLSANMPKSFTFLYSNYNKEISHCMTDYFVHPSEGPEPNDATNTEHWISVIKSMLRSSRSYNSKEPFYDQEMERISKTITSNAKILDLLILDTHLPNKNEIATKKLKI